MVKVKYIFVRLSNINLKACAYDCPQRNISKFSNIAYY